MENLEVTIKKRIKHSSTEAPFTLTISIDSEMFELTVPSGDVKMLAYLLSKDKGYNENMLIDVPLKVEERFFTNDEDEQVSYLNYSFDFNDVPFNLKPLKEDKRLLNLLIREKFGI